MEPEIQKQKAGIGVNRPDPEPIQNSVCLLKFPPPTLTSLIGCET